MNEAEGNCLRSPQPCACVRIPVWVSIHIPEYKIRTSCKFLCLYRCSWHLCCLLWSLSRWSRYGAWVRTAVLMPANYWLVMNGSLCVFMHTQNSAIQYAGYIIDGISLHVYCVCRSLTGAGIFITTVVIGSVIIVTKARPFNIGEHWLIPGRSYTQDEIKIWTSTHWNEEWDLES